MRRESEDRFGPFSAVPAERLPTYPAMEAETRPKAWYHTIDLPGETTPGFADTRDAVGHIEWPDEIDGGRCLDVGTFDGFWAFEMERRGGAEVIALDVEDPDAIDWPYDWRESGPQRLREEGTLGGHGFRYAAAALGSSVERRCASVYDLDPEEHGRFDVVWCGALLLHLRDPIRALEHMRSVCDGELVLVENLDPLLDLITRPIPSARLAPYDDTWWRVNSAGMRMMLERAGFRVTWAGRRFLVGNGPGGLESPPWLNSIAALRPRRRGALHRAYRARPRPATGR